MGENWVPQQLNVTHHMSLATCLQAVGTACCRNAGAVVSYVASKVAPAACCGPEASPDGIIESTPSHEIPPTQGRWDHIENKTVE